MNEDTYDPTEAMQLLRDPRAVPEKPTKLWPVIMVKLGFFRYICEWIYNDGSIHTPKNELPVAKEPIWDCQLFSWYEGTGELMTILKQIYHLGWSLPRHPSGISTKELERLELVHMKENAPIPGQKAIVKEMYVRNRPDYEMEKTPLWYQDLKQIFNDIQINGHIMIAASHRIWVKNVYLFLRFLDCMMIEHMCETDCELCKKKGVKPLLCKTHEYWMPHILSHDISKYSFEEAIPYSYTFQTGGKPNFVSADEANVRPILDETWKKGLKHHYKFNAHHPEHFQDPDFDLECSNYRMELQHSCIDKMAVRMERNINPESKSEISITEMTDIPSYFFKAYPESDKTYALGWLKDINAVLHAAKDCMPEEFFKYCTIFFQGKQLCFSQLEMQTE